ncbi:MAG: hypothetical protein AAF483_18610 [Planctomycetota bacterium]
MLYAVAVFTFLLCGFLPGALAFFIARLLAPLWVLVLFLGLSYQLLPFVDQLYIWMAIRYEFLAPWHGTWLAQGGVLILTLLGGCILTLLALLLGMLAALLCFGAGIYEVCLAIQNEDLHGFWNILWESAQLGATRCAIAGAIAGLCALGADES